MMPQNIRYHDGVRLTDRQTRIIELLDILDTRYNGPAPETDLEWTVFHILSNCVHFGSSF